MAKRFTDTDKWKKPFIRGLEGPYKLLWFYILDDCDMAGIWQPDFEVARIRIGEQVEKDQAIRVFGDRIQIFGTKWFIKDFIKFQYGELKESNRMHKAVINTLLQNEISTDGASEPLPRAQGQEQGKGQGKGQGSIQGQGLSKAEIFNSIFTDEIFFEKLKMAHGNKDLKKAFEECYTHHSESDNPPRELWQWRQKLNTWLTIKPEERKKNGHAHKKLTLKDIDG